MNNIIINKDFYSLLFGSIYFIISAFLLIKYNERKTDLLNKYEKNTIEFKEKSLRLRYMFILFNLLYIAIGFLLTVWLT